jgi:hypothetical protein
MLIILYGEVSNKTMWKHQRMIDGGATCGYREYAKHFGSIVYVTPQKVSLPWEKSIFKPKEILKYIKKYPDAVVWSVKNGPRKDSEVLSKISNKKVYYSCNAKNRNCKFADINLIDTPERIKHANKDKLWVKGKDPEYWKPQGQRKEFDYLLIGTRGDKNETYFLKQLNEVKEKRKILWIGGEKHKEKIKTNHQVVCTGFLGQDDVRDNIPRAKVGVLFTELKIEGFPQSFCEMTMCGVPVVYNINAPRNKFYFHKSNSVLSNKQKIVSSAENLLARYDPVLCREAAIENYSLEKAYRRILECLK